MLEPSKEDLEKAHKLVTDYFCFHEKDLMRNGESNDYWIQKQTQDIAQALAELRAEGESFVAEAVRQVEASDKLYRQQCQKINTLEERVREYKTEWESALYREQGLKSRNEELEKKLEYFQSFADQNHTLVEKVTLENESLKAELHEATLRASEYKNEWESALYREQGLKADNEQYWALAKQHQEALKSSQKALGEMKLYHHNAKEEVHRLTSALARAHEALLECEVDIKDSLGVLSKETEEMVKQALSDPIGQIVFEKWKKMGAVVEAARACYEEDDFITENSPGSFERDKKLGEALEALDAKGEGK